jgi:hypothetical protein
VNRCCFSHLAQKILPNRCQRVDFVLFIFKRAVGIEPTTTAWKAMVLPLNYARAFAQYIIGRQQEARVPPIACLITPISWTWRWAA